MDGQLSLDVIFCCLHDSVKRLGLDLISLTDLINPRPSLSSAPQREAVGPEPGGDTRQIKLALNKHELN